MNIQKPSSWVMEISDVDFNAEGTPEEWRARFKEYPLFIVRNQKMDQNTFLEAMKKIGFPIQQKFRQSYVVEMRGKGKSQLSSTSELGWHSDESYNENYPDILSLFAVQIPPDSGRTHFANLHRAFISLPTDEQKELRELNCVHAFEHFDSYLSDLVEFESEEYKKMSYAYGKCVQPVVRLWEGQPYLCLNQGFTTEILDAPEGSLDRLYEKITAPENVYSHTWKAGDFVVCNNHLLIHRRDASDDPTRFLYRGLMTFKQPY